MKSVGVLYEHPEWFKPLFAELDRRGVPYEHIDAGAHGYDPDATESEYALVVNRMSPSAWTRGQSGAIFHTLHYLAWLDRVGANVVNGYGAYRLELSKAAQCALFSTLRVPYPVTRVVNSHEAAMVAAANLRFPVLFKPNVGGSGAGIRSFDAIDELAAADLDFGLDGAALIQERIPAAEGSIVRVEILDGEFLYAIRIRLVPGSFNLCPADYCELAGVESFEPPADLIEDAKRIVAAAGMDLAGVEYVVDERDGEPYFYDLNALSNFVADAPRIIGFDPFVNLADLIVSRAERCVAAAA